MKFFIIIVLVMAQIAAVSADDAAIHDGSVINETLNSTFVINADAMDAECARTFECKEHEGQFYFNCYYDFADAKCRCFIGAKSDCRAEASAYASGNEVSGAIASGNESAVSAAALYLKKPVVQGSLLFAFLAFAVALYFMRTGTSDSVKAAVRYHRLAEHYHEKGEEKMAEHYYHLSEKYRELGEEKRNVVEKD